MLPQLSAIPLQTTDTSAASARNLNQLLPVGQNVSATIVAVSRDQVQPDIFRLKLEINNRLIQMGVFQALPVGQKINVNRQSDGQIQITPQSNQNSSAPARSDSASSANNPQAPANPAQNGQRAAAETLLSLKLPSFQSSQQLPDAGRIIAAVISSRPAYPQSQTTQAQTNQAQTATSTSNTPSNQSTGTTNTPNTLVTTAQNQASTNTQTSSPTSNPASNSSTPATNSAPTTANANQVATQQTPVTTNLQNTVPLQTAESARAATPSTTPAAPASGQSQPQGNIPSPAPIPTSIRNTEQAPQPQVQTPANQAASQVSQPIRTDAQANTSAQTSRPSAPPTHHVLTLALPNGAKVEANSPRPLPQGTQVLLQKTDTDSAQILKLQTPNIDQKSALEKPAIQEILRTALPNQLPTGDAFSQLAQTAASNTPQTAQISSIVRSMLQLFGVQPGNPESPAQIRRNIELGGLGTERSLSQGQASPQDMKSQLQQLNKLAEGLPAEQRNRMEQLLQGIHARVTSQQLNSLQQWKELPDGGFERVLQLDLPIKQGDKWDNLELRLSREGGSNAAGEMVSIWRVRLHFDLEEQGGVDAEIRLTDEQEISTYFWCDKPETAENLRGRSEEFAERLRECGFQNSMVQSQSGQAPEQKQVVHKQLVDLHT